MILSMNFLIKCNVSSQHIALVLVYYVLSLVKYCRCFLVELENTVVAAFRRLKAAGNLKQFFPFMTDTDVLILLLSNRHECFLSAFRILSPFEDIRIQSEKWDDTWR